MLQGAHTNVLPIGYTRLEFLESTGTQYINTGIRLAEGFVLRGEFAPTQVLEHGCVFGSRLSSAMVHFMRNGTKGIYTTTTIRNGSNYVVSFYVNLNESYSLELNDIDKKVVVNGKETSGLDFYSMPELDFYIFCANFPQGGNLANGARAVFFDAIRLMSFEVTNAGCRHNFIPAIDDVGTPCMFDLVSKQPFRNAGSGQFIAGMTLAQARKLGNLPAGTTLTVSLPVGWQEDEGVVNAMAQATEKGCVITQADDWSNGGSAASSSFALRRVWVRKVQDENGSYADADGSRWLVEWCVDVIGADPESLGYERFRSVEVAAEYWGLTPYVDPETETIES